MIRQKIGHACPKDRVAGERTGPRLRLNEMKSAHVTLTIVAAMGIAARAQGADPCAPGTFNRKACKAAVRHGGFCSGGQWIGSGYQESYPYYYDLYRQRIAAGESVVPAAVENCAHAAWHDGWWWPFFGGGHVRRAGFGATGRGGHE